MIVLDIKFKPNKKTCDVVLSDGQVLNLTSEALVKYRIYKNENIEDNVLLSAINESEKAKALDKAMVYLSKGYRSESQLRKYLKEKKYSSDIQEFVIKKLHEYKYIDDQNLANIFVESSASKMGINKIKQKLYEKGISKKIIEDITESIDEEEQFNICLKMCQKKWETISKSKPEILDKEAQYKFNQSLKQKLSRYLYSNGFDWDMIKRAINVTTKLNEDE